MVHKKVHKNYLFCRNGNFYFRWKVPLELRSVVGVSEVRRSLSTSDMKVATARVDRLRLILSRINNVVTEYKIGEISYESLISVVSTCAIDLKGKERQMRFIRVKDKNGVEVVR